MATSSRLLPFFRSTSFVESGNLGDSTHSQLWPMHLSCVRVCIAVALTNLKMSVLSRVSVAAYCIRSHIQGLRFSWADEGEQGSLGIESEDDPLITGYLMRAH